MCGTHDVRRGPTGIKMKTDAKVVSFCFFCMFVCFFLRDKNFTEFAYLRAVLHALHVHFPFLGISHKEVTSETK